MWIILSSRVTNINLNQVYGFEYNDTNKDFNQIYEERKKKMANNVLLVSKELNLEQYKPGFWEYIIIPLAMSLLHF